MFDAFFLVERATFEIQFHLTEHSTDNIRVKQDEFNHLSASYNC